MKEYWEITYARYLASAPVWGMKPLFELNNLDRPQYLLLGDSLPLLAQARDTAENQLTDGISAKGTAFALLSDVATRLPGLVDGMLADDDVLHNQLDPIYAIDVDVSEAHTLRRCRLLIPFWADVNAARLGAGKLAVRLDLAGGGDIGSDEFNSAVAAALSSQKAEAVLQNEVTKAKGLLRAAERKLDRANKRWYKAWLKAYPAGTPEGNAALADVPAEGGVAQAAKLEIDTMTPLADHTIQVTLDPEGGAHATTKELQTLLPNETEFGHTVPITGNVMVLGPYAAGTLVQARVRTANSNPGSVLSAVKSAVVI